MQRELYDGLDTGWIPTPDTPALLFDIETDGLLDSCSKVHCICAKEYPGGRTYSFGPGHIEEGLELLASAPLLVAHNGLCFDSPALAKLYPDVRLPEQLFDTLTASRLIWTNLKDLDFERLRKQARRKGGVPFPAKLCGKHSLEAWGYRLGEYKGEYGKKEDAWAAWSQEMQDYCMQDVEVLDKLYRLILEQDYSPEALAIEHEFQKVIFQQEQDGAPFDEREAMSLYASLCAKRDDIKRKLCEMFPPKRMEEVFIPKANNTARGYVKGQPFIKVRYVEFNPGSTQMIAERLAGDYGWQPSEFTPTGLPKVDGDTLGSLDYPPCPLLCEYLELTKIMGMLADGNNGWLKLVRDGKLHGRVITCGAVTGRCTHNSPNLAQIPAHGTYGHACRSLFRVDPARPGWVQVGADASGLELRMLGHYMARYDGGAYVRELLDGDIHTANQKAAGLATRDNAKTFIYAFLYGAGDTKLGSIVEPYASPARQAQIGKRLKAKFFKAIPAIKCLIDDVQAAVSARPWLYGIDKRRLHVRSKHAALNTLLQSAGAVLVKLATVICNKEAKARFGWVQGRDYTQILHVHDEAQFQCPAEHAEALGKLFVESIEMAGRHFAMRCPTTGEYKIGNNWAETH